jgi:hypothetical protein
MVERLRLLWIAESEDDARALDRAEEALSCTFERRRLRASECEGALAEGTWQLIVCSVSRHDRPNALASLAARSRDALPQWIVIADDFEDVALDAYALGALVCERDGLSLQLTAAMRHVRDALEDRTEERKTRAFEQGQRDVLERIATGAPVSELLAAIVRLVELQSDDMRCSILLLDRERSSLFHGASSSLPAEFVRAIDGTSIGPTAGSCGAAAFRGERVIVEDIATHPN